MPRKSEASQKKDLEPKDLNSKCEVLPRWQPEVDQPSSLEKFIRYYRTEKCADFQAGHCELHKPKMQCFNFHFEGQRRRSPIGPDGTLRYWELPCKWISQPSKCPRGDQCTLAHSKGEISYHPAKYKTRVCNGSDCQKATCCFAHSDKELRCKAAARYSHHSAARGLKDVPEETEENWDEPPGKPTVDLSTFKVFPCRKSRGVQHDRKLCPFFHNPRDRRRPPGTYSAEPCDECFDSMAEQREGATSTRSSCSRGDACRFCHNRPELLYHESVFKRRFCATFPKVETCQRGDLCASRTAVKRSELSCYSQKRRSSWWTGSLQRLLSRILPPWISSRGASKRFGARTAHNMDGTNACTHTPTRTRDVGQNWDTVVNLVQSGPSMSEKNCTTMSDAPMDCGAALLTVPRSSYIILSTTRRCPALTGRARALALEDPSVPFFTDRKSSATSLRSKKTLWKVVFPRSCQFWRLKLPFLGGSRLWKAVILEWTAQLLQQPVLMEPLR